MTPTPLDPTITHVLDTSAVIAYLNKELGWDVVAAILANPKNVCAIHSLNLCEVWHMLRITQSESQTDKIVAALTTISKIVERSDMDEQFWKQAARNRHEFRSSGVKGVALMDCFAMALASRINAPIVAADRGDFEPAQQKNICRVVFIRASRSQALGPAEFKVATQA